MAAAAFRGCASSLTRGAQAISGSEGRSLLAALEALRLREEAAPVPSPRQSVQDTSARHERRKTITIHIGAALHVPVDDSRYTAPAAEPAPAAASLQSGAHRDPFEGVPLRAWAERMGERLMPAYEVLREEQRRAKAAEKAGAAEPRPMAVPSVPHLLPFTRWAASSKTMQDTFIVDDPKTRKKARMSWYNPNDGMVPRGWFSDGLLKDLAYYRPFCRSAPEAAAL